MTSIIIFDPLSITIIGLISIIFIIGFTCNLLLILVLYKTKTNAPIYDTYIINLAIADLLLIFNLPIVINQFLYTGGWTFGWIACKVHSIIGIFGQFASSLFSTGMSFDRYFAICHSIHAFKYRRLRIARTIIRVIWLTCTIIILPIVFLSTFDHKKMDCYIDWSRYPQSEAIYSFSTLLIAFILPASLISIFYIRVIIKMRSLISSPMMENSTMNATRKRYAPLRINHVVTGTIVAFILCWLPYWATQSCLIFLPLRKHYYILLGKLMVFINCLTYLNSAINPLLYIYLSKDFKRRCIYSFRSSYIFRSMFRDDHTNFRSMYYWNP